MERLRAGYALVPNPLNPRQVSRVSLSPADVAGIVFWSKNPRPLLPCLKELDRLHLPYYFQFTITCYPRDLEPRTPSWEEAIDTFRRLSNALGPTRVVWRYDPIVLSRRLHRGYHLQQVERTARALEGEAVRLVISFLDMYRKTERNLRATSSTWLEQLVRTPDKSVVHAMTAELATCAGAFGFQVEACAEEVDLSSYGVRRGRCIDPELLGLSNTAAFRKDPGQREVCGCAVSRDVGMYDSCLHGCAFCYANSSDAKAIRNRALLHRVDGPCLLATGNSDHNESETDAGLEDTAEEAQLRFDGLGRTD